MPLTCTVIRRDRVFNSVLPDEVEGKHWISDLDGRGLPRRLASIEAVDGSWQLRPQTGVRLYDEGGHLCEQSILRPDVGLYHLGKKGEATMSLLVRRPGEQDRQFTRLGLSKDTEISIGRSEHNRFKLSSPFVSANHALLRLWRGSFYLADCDSANGVYVNGKAIAKQRFVPLSSGDVITILGLKIVICARQIAFNNPKGQLRVRPHPSDLPCRLAQTNRFASDQLGRALQVEEEKLKRGAKLFHRSPRIRSAISERSLEIEDPPAPAVHEEPPALLRIGPSLCMALASAMMGLYMLSNLISEQGNMLRALPMLAMVVVMILGAVLWPNLQSRYSKKKEAKTEARRQQVYSEYLGLRWAEIAAEIERQRKILIENRVSVDECFRRVLNHDRSLFERTPTQHDFLELRLGTGDVPLRMSLRWPTGKLSLRGDPLLDRVVELSRVPQLLQAVPVAIALVEQYVCGILGVARPDTVGTHTQGRKELWGFLRGLIAQIAVLHAPDEVKIVLFVEPGEEPEWGPLANLPHLFDQDFRMRFTATNAAEAQALSIRLERELVARQVMQRSEVLSDYGAYYVVICANCELQHRVRLLSSLAEARENRGFSLISVADSIHQLPKECQRIIDLAPDDRIAGNKALGYRTALNIAGTQLGRVFCPRDQAVSDLFFATDKALANSACKRLADELASLQLPEPQSLAKLPRSIGFLEMFQVGKPEHLNISGRWQKSNPTYSLAAPLGIGEDGGLVMLDIHENAHGPHGLIAGMTGSGKSELIITWLLSMAISYRPDEVAFVLIDYKGGGLAGAFASAGARLPHVAGTITNLEGAAINRSLISIQSELRRRQAAFNRARDIAGLGTMDIYKYQELYRLGLLSEPMPHLLIVSDEFAELKDQQPEFMEQLVSAARIGRSLGVHLVLATQKPSGVVTDQIWSNARFKICLKVADSSDSNEMIKRPDAAELTDAGRFYQQVGYNEYFTQGQSAYAGSRYLPSEQFIPRRDDTVVLIDRIGRAQYALGPERVSLGQNSDTPQSVAVLRQIIQVAESEGLRAPALWLEPIPALITLADLMRKYGLDDDHQNIVETTELTAIIGELDDPACQRQDVLRLPLGAEGNVIVYGAAGSGKEALLNALLCSLLYRHTARTLNCYLLDFGAESLGVFRQAPQVGDVVFSSDVEKLESFFRMMLAEIERRRKLLAEVDGGFAGYAPPARAGSGAPPSALPATDASPRADGPLPPTPPTAASPQPAGALPAAGAPPLPAILIVVNGFDAFMELNEQYAEDLGKLARDGLRCGIHCAITCTRANAVPYRLQPNFKQRLVLRLNSKDEYLTILGSLEGVVAPAGYGRGLVSRGGLYEFQTAQITANGIDGQAIRSYCAQLDAAAASDAPRAAQVPVLPEVVDAAALAGLMAAECFSLQQLPLGISKLSLKPCLANLARTPVLLALSEDEQLLSRFLSGLADVLNRVADLRVVVFDPDALLPRPSAADQRLQHLSAYDAVFEELSTLLEGKSDQRFAGSSPEGTLLIFTSLRSLVEKMPDPLKEPWARFWSDGHYRDFAGIVIAGSASRFTSFGFEPWFRELCSYGSGIWLGDGFDAQQLLRPGSYDSAHRQRHPDDLAWIVSKGSCHLARYVVSIFH